MGCRWGLSLLAGALFACSPPRQRVAERPSLLEASRPLDDEPSRAEWRYHPREPAHLARAYDIAPGQRLFVGGLGERWLVEPGTGARATALLAPEPLLGALRSGGWIFVGQSGATYAADTPLGPLLRASAPPRGLGAVDVGRSTLLGVTEDGSLLLSEDAGASWHGVGPGGVRFSNVLLVPPHALAIEVPERLWASEDEGRTFRPLEVPPFGALRFARDEESGPIVEAALGARVLRLDRSPPELTLLGRAPRPEQLELPSPPLPGPSGRALAAGRAFVSDGRYFEIDLGVRAEVLSGPFSGALARRPLPALSACQEVYTAGFGSWVYVACTRERVGAARRYEFFRSVDGGQSFERESYVARGNPELVKLAVGADGALLATGFCSTKDDVAGCRPQGIQLRRASSSADAGAAAELETIPAPALEDAALALAFAANGRTAYAVGTRTKSDALFVFVATDLERGFQAREIAQLERSGLPVVRQVRSFGAARSGELSLVIAQGSGPDQLVVLDASGRTLSVNSAPFELAAIGAYGSRALAVGPDEAWQSLNGGAQWDSLGPLPRSVCSGPRTRCSAPLACTREGCGVGDQLSRVGWQVPAGSVSALLPPKARHAASSQPALGGSFGCELIDAEWTGLAGVDHLPDASQAALGKAAWFALGSDDATAAAGLWIADTASTHAEGAARVRRSELLAPSGRAADSAYYATLQVEGGAALRYLVAAGDATPSSRIAHVEVAWENLFEGRRGRALIADAGGPLPGDFIKTTGPARHARADLLSISSGGIYVRIHHQPEHDQVTYFLDGSSVQQVPPFTANLLPLHGLSSEMVRADGEHLSVSFLERGATVVRAQLERQHWKLDAMTIGFVDPEPFSLRQQRDITYLQGRAAVHSATRYANGTSEAFVFPLLAQGPVFGAKLPVPTQADVADRTLGCSTQQLELSPRVLAPHDPGTRRAVLVRDRVEPLRIFLTDTAVLYGTPSSPCVAAYDAEPVRTSASASATRERLLLSADGPSWLFRAAPEGARRGARIEYRSMRCSTEGAAEIPAEVYDLPDTHTGG